MQQHPIDTMMQTTMEQIRSMVDVNTVIGEAIESRDGSTGGFFADNVQAGQQVWVTVNLLLRLDRNWMV